MVAMTPSAIHPTTFSTKGSLRGLGLPIHRREMLFWLVIFLLANQVVQLLSVSAAPTFLGTISNQNYIYWFACYVVLKRVWVSTDRPVTRNETYAAIILIIAISLSSLIAYRFAVGVLATALAIYLMVVCRDEPSLRAAGAVLAAISAHLVWGPLIFQFLTPELLHADAVLVSVILKLFSSEIFWTGATTFYTPGSFSISLVGGCSSFHNLSTAVLACVAMTMYMRTEWASRDIMRLIAACAAMIALNDIHICLMARSAKDYEFWHDGSGAALFSFLTTAALLLAAVYGARPKIARA